MKISEAIIALKNCLSKFGDAECKFLTTSDGNPAIELHNVDSTTAQEDAALRFNARFPTKNIFIPSRN
jgi:hypothetical protein